MDMQQMNAEDCRFIQHGTERERRDAEARLVANNERLVLKVVQKYSGMTCPGFDFEDMMQCARMGLLRAARTYREETSRFSNYAWQWIRQAVINGYYEYGFTVRVPAYLFKTVMELTRKYGVAFYDPCFPIKVKEDCSLTAKQKISVCAAIKTMTPVSLDYSVDEDDSGGTEMGDLIPGGMNVEHDAICSSVRKSISNGISEELNPREAWVISNRFGVGDAGGTGGHTLEWCGENYPWGGVSRERIRQIEKKALAKLRCRGERQGWREYL